MVGAVVGGGPRRPRGCAPGRTGRGPGQPGVLGARADAHRDRRPGRRPPSSTGPTRPPGWARARPGRWCWAPRSTSPTPIPVHSTRPAPDAPALICYTSGTTGAPKGAVLSHRNLLAATEAVRIAWRWTPDDRLVHCLPVFHAHGLCVGVYGTLLAGASALLLPGFDPTGRGRRGPVAGGVDVLRCPHHVPPPGGVRARRRPRRPPPVRVRVGAAAGRAARRGQRGGGLGRARTVRHDRDADERLQSLRGGAPPGHGGIPPARGGGAARPPATRSWSGDPTSSAATGNDRRPRPTPSHPPPTTGRTGSAPATSVRTTTATWSSAGARRS